MTNIDLVIRIIVIIMLFAFFIVRSRFTNHYKKFTSRTLVKYIILVPLFYCYLVGYLDFAKFDLSIYSRLIAGFILILFGMSLFFWAHKNLGINWSPIIEKKFSKSRTLIQSGPYRYIRHPIYTASFITLFGLGILTANWFISGLPLFILILFYIKKIPQEEKELIHNFGKRYVEYMKKTGGLIPKMRS